MGEGLPPYEGYKPDVHPGVSHVFQSAAFRFGHTMIPPGIYRRDGACHFRETPMGFLALRLCSTWWDSSVSENVYRAEILNEKCLLQSLFVNEFIKAVSINHLMPNDHYSGRTAPLNSKRCILCIYSTNICTEYFKHGIYFPFFFFLSKMQFVL